MEVFANIAPPVAYTGHDDYQYTTHSHHDAGPRHMPILSQSLLPDQVDRPSLSGLATLVDCHKPALPSVSDILSMVDWRKPRQSATRHHTLVDEQDLGPPVFSQYSRLSTDYTTAELDTVDAHSSSTDGAMLSLDDSPSTLTWLPSSCPDSTNVRGSFSSASSHTAGKQSVPVLGSPFQPTRSLAIPSTTEYIISAQDGAERYMSTQSQLFPDMYPGQEPLHTHARYLQYPQSQQQVVSYERHFMPAQQHDSSITLPMASLKPIDFLSNRTTPPLPANKHQHHHSLGQNSLVLSSDPERYACEICQKTFARPSSLKIHYHSHTGEKPHKCARPGCDKAFSVRSNMKRHERGCAARREHDGGGRRGHGRKRGHGGGRGRRFGTGDGDGHGFGLGHGHSQPGHGHGQGHKSGHETLYQHDGHHGMLDHEQYLGHPIHSFRSTI